MLFVPVPVTWITYVPAVALLLLYPPQPLASSTPAESASTTIIVNTPALRLRSRQKIQPNNALRGSSSPAMYKLSPCAPRLFMAAAPPLSGELVSMVNCAVAVPFAARVTDGLENVQVTCAGSEAQPSPIVSVKPPSEVRFTCKVPFCEAASVNVAGVTVRLNPAGAPVMLTAAEVDGLCIVSPL